LRDVGKPILGPFNFIMPPPGARNESLTAEKHFAHQTYFSEKPGGHPDRLAGRDLVAVKDPIKKH